MSPENPRKWRFTWEAQSHLPILKLFLFSSQINPITHCKNLNISLHFEKSLLNLTWNHQNPSNLITLIVPLPRVLVDLESPLSFRALDDHIEVKIPLLLPVDHPIVSSFISELNSGDDVGDCGSLLDRFLEPLSMDSDFGALSSKGEVDFYCRSCGFKVTKHPVRCLVDMPSVNWTDVADNWFGGCCSSFGGISEKLVAKYVNSYRCAEGTCLLTTVSVVLCKDDVAGFMSSEADQLKRCDEKGFADMNSDSNDKIRRSVCNSTESPVLYDALTKPVSLQLQTKRDFVNGENAECDDDCKEKPSCKPSGFGHVKGAEAEHHCCSPVASESCLENQELNGPVGLQAEQKSLLNCYLGNAFLFRSSGISKDIEWIDFACPQCSCTLGAYPCRADSEPLDGGIRLLKCYISLTPSTNLSDDLFSKYTMERIFTCQLLESAKDELSFRTVVKDLKTKSSMLHIVLVNPNSWCCSGCCSEDMPEQLGKINLHPVVKVLFSCSSDNIESELRINEEWETKYQVDEVFMLTHLIKELMKSMERSKDAYPSSFSSSHGFLLSSILR